MKKIELGGVIRMDPAALVDTRMMLCANSGGGKSHALRLIAEQVGNQIPTIIIDPEGEWASLRTHVHAVLVGPNGDVQADPKLAKKLAKRLLEVDCSAVLDLSDLKTQPKRAFVREFIEGLLAAPRSLWGARLVVIDEAHKFAPEAGREAESRQAIIDLMDSGRKRGLGGLLATQRMSKIAKDAMAEANNLMLGRCAQDIDLRRASDLLGFAGKSEWPTMRTFKRGEFFAFGPAFDHDGIVRFRTRKELKTEHPKPGARHLIKPPKPSQRVKGMLAKMGDLPQEVQAEADELKTLRVQVRDLQKELRAASKGAPVDVEHTAAQRQEVRDLRVALKNVKREMDKVAKENFVQRQTITRAFQAMERNSQALWAAIDKPVAVADDTPDIPPAVHRPSSPAPVSRVSATPPNGTSRSSSGSGFDRMLRVLAQHGEMDRGRLALIAGLKANTGTFRNYVSRGRVDGVWITNGGVMAITETGIEAAGDFEPLPEGQALVEYWRGHKSVPTRAGEMLVFITGLGDAGATRDEIAEHVGIQVNTGTFRNYLSRLRSLGLIGRGDPIVAAEVLR